jgi:FMN phosphatase YigB (HAD superfamily)
MDTGNEKKIITFDLDDTLCEGYPYHLAKPKYDMIKIVNELYAKGHKIIIYTGRGMSKGYQMAVMQYWDLTIEQLEAWGINYHEFEMGKPHYDIMICDKVVNSRQIQSAEDVIIFADQIKPRR